MYVAKHRRTKRTETSSVGIEIIWTLENLQIAIHVQNQKANANQAAYRHDRLLANRRAIKRKCSGHVLPLTELINCLANSSSRTRTPRTRANRQSNIQERTAGKLGNLCA